MSIFNSSSSIKHGADTSKDTVMPDVLLEGYTAHDAEGKPITGTHVCRTPKMQEKTVRENGVFEPDEGYTGFSKITVAVEGSGDDYKVRVTSAIINPPTVQAAVSLNKNAVVRSYSVTAIVSALE